MRKFILLLVSVCTIVNLSAQILQESFDNVTFPPAGWYNSRILPSVSTTTGIWDRTTQSTNPTFNPHSGAAMARFNSWNISSNTETEFGTPVLNLSGGASHRLRFWIYRHSTNTFSDDKVDVYINTQTNITGATKLKTVFVSRFKDQFENADGWYEIVADIPSSYNTNTNYIIFRAQSKGANAVCIDDVVVETANCFVPTSASVTNITETGVTLNWNDPATGSPSGYEWEVRIFGSPGTGAAGLAASGTTTAPVKTASVTGLTQGTNYNFYVRSSCGAEKSTWTTETVFRTSCAVFTLPYTENFDGTTFGLPPCNVVENINGGFQWSTLVPFYFGYTANSGSNALISVNGAQFGVTTSGPQNDWYYTPLYNFEAGKCYRLSFMYKVNFPSAPQSLQVKFGAAQNALAMNSTAVFSNTNITSPSYVNASSYISVSTTGTYYIGFHHNGGSSGGILFVDDISLQESIGTPVDMVASSVTASSATLNWNAPACGTATTYEWELRTSGAAGSGAAGLVNSGAGNVLTTSLTGLSEQANYSFYIRSKTATLTGEWTSATTFQTLCAIRTLPYNENFDAVFVPNLPACYIIQNVTAPYNPWNGWQNVSFERPNSSPNAMRISTSNSTSAADNWLFTPPFSFTAGKSYRLIFYYRNTFYFYPEKLEVKYGMGAMAAAMLATPVFSNTDIRNSIYKKAVVDFVPGQTGNYNIGFHYISAALQHSLFIDDIKVEETPACDVVQNIEAKNITAATAVINWQLPLAGTPDGFQWELRTDGAAGSGTTGLVTLGTLPTGSITKTLTGLTANTLYSFYIRSTCGAQNGEWVKHSFTSACSPVTLPYSEKFDGIPVKSLPVCTAVEDTKDHFIWNVASTYSNSSPNSLTHESETLSPLDDWFFTAPLQLESGKNYKLSFYVRQQASGSRDAIEIYVGNYAQSSSMTSAAIYSNSSITNTSFQLVNVDFTVPSTGVYYLGIRSVPVPFYSRGTLIDDISVVENITTPVRDIVQTGNDLLKNIYPNPVDASFMLKVNRKYDAGKMIVRIRDMQGRLVQSAELNLGGSENYRVETEGLTSGLYLIETIHLRSGKKQTISMRKK